MARELQTLVVPVNWRVLKYEVRKNRKKPFQIPISEFQQAAEVMVLNHTCGKNCTHSIFTGVLLHANQTSASPTKPPDSLGICNVTTEMRTIEILFYESSTIRSFGLIDVLEFGERQENIHSNR